jgi:hypothetical protein
VHHREERVEGGGDRFDYGVKLDRLFVEPDANSGGVAVLAEIEVHEVAGEEDREGDDRVADLFFVVAEAIEDLAHDDFDVVGACGRLVVVEHAQESLDVTLPVWRLDKRAERHSAVGRSHERDERRRQANIVGVLEVGDQRVARRFERGARFDRKYVSIHGRLLEPSDHCPREHPPSWLSTLWTPKRMSCMTPGSLS